MNTTPNPSNKKTAPGALWEDTKQTASHVADQAGEKLMTQIDATKETATGKAGAIASALRGTREQLEDVGPLPDLADMAADQIERLADYIEHRNVGELVSELERYARREPAIFLGASLAAGLLIGRVLKSNPAADESEDTLPDFGEPPRLETKGFASAPIGATEVTKLRNPYTSASSSVPSAPSTSSAAPSAPRTTPPMPAPPPMVDRTFTTPTPAMTQERPPSTRQTTTPGFDPGVRAPSGDGHRNGGTSRMT